MAKGNGMACESRPKCKTDKSAIVEASHCYNCVSQKKPHIILVPMAVDYESNLSASAALTYLSNSNGHNVLIVGANVEEHNSELDVAVLKDANNDDSVTGVAAVLNSTSKHNTEYAILGRDPDRCANEISTWISTASYKRTVVFVYNSKHLRKDIPMMSDQNAIGNCEGFTVRSLLNGDVRQVDSYLKQKSGVAESWSHDTVNLRVLVRLVKMMEYQGIVTCYTDNYGRRKCWSNETYSEVSSYLSMVWVEKTEAPCMISNFDKEMLLSYSYSCLARDTSLSLPCWSPWHLRKNGVILQYSRVDSACVSSVAVYESESRTIVDNVSIATMELSTAMKGWKTCPNRDRISEEATITLFVMDRMSSWTTVHPLEVGTTVSATDKYCMVLHIKGKMCSYSPSVWMTYRNLTFYEMVSRLCVKAGCGEGEWMQESVRISLIRAHEIRRVAW